MNISELQAKAVRLEQELQDIRDLLAKTTHSTETVTDNLARTRAYAFNASAIPFEEAVQGGVDSLNRYGFCVIDNVIPTDRVDAICEEILAAQSTITQNMKGLRELLSKNEFSEQESLEKRAVANKVELRPVRRVGHPPKPPNDIV